MKLSHDSAFLLAMCASDASSWSIAEFDSKWRVFQVTVSLNIRKDSVAENLPPSRGNGEGNSNKQLELPHQQSSSQQLVLDSRFTHWGISGCNPTLCHELNYNRTMRQHSGAPEPKWNRWITRHIFPPDSEKSSGNETKCGSLPVSRAGKEGLRIWQGVSLECRQFIYSSHYFR